MRRRPVAVLAAPYSGEHAESLPQRGADHLGMWGKLCPAPDCCDPATNTWTVQLDHFSEYAVGTDPCRPTTTAKLAISKVVPPPGDESLTFKGSFTVTPPVATALDPTTNGLTVRLVDGTTVVLDAGLPAGAFNPVAKTGWKVNGLGTKWTYTGPKTGAIGGIRKVALADQSKKTPGLVAFTIVGKGSSYAASPAVTADVVLPASGQCFQAAWPATPPAKPSCVLAGTSLKCQ